MFSGVKQGKERISLGFCCNADGTDKRPIAYVGQSAKPRAFAGKTPNNYGYRYWNNKKAWFNSIIFGEWLSELDQEMRKQDRQIILLVDNFSAHQKALQTFTPTNVKMEFFSANLTSHCQPLDQGIIRAFKAHFQLRKTRYTLGRLELGDDDPWKVTIRQAMTFADEAWKNVTAETCFNCWKHSGVLPGTGPSAPAAKTQDEAAPEVDQSNDRNRAWDIVMHALDHEQSIPELVSALTTSLGEGFDLSEWQAAINLTCYEDDEAREENRTTLQGLRSKDPLSQTDDGAGKVLGKAGEVKTTTSEKMPELVELEAALGLALLQTGCIEGKQSLAVAELLGDDIQVQAQDDVEMTKLDEEELVTEIVNRMKQEKADVVELSDEEEEEGETMPPSVSKYAGDMSEELLAEINEAVKTLSNLTIARPEEHFVDKLGRDLQQLKKWSDKAHFHLPRKQPTIKSFFSKSATNADTVSTLTTDMEE
jgi:cell division protein FtsB